MSRSDVWLLKRANAWVATCFGLSLFVYAVTRLWALDRFPIYFFADETVHPLLAQDLLARGFRDARGAWFPLYFEAAGLRWTPLLSAYVHAISVGLFGKSLLVTRATSAVVSLLGAAAVGLILKLIFRARYWWAGVLLLAVTPAWFLHSRTAFETAMMSSFYAGFLLCYLLYRTRSPRYLYAALAFGAITFYTYSNGQSLMAVAGVLLFVSDIRYHWEQRHTVGRCLALGVVLLWPLILFRLQHPSAFGDHLRAIDSYLFQKISVSAKFIRIAQTYLYGLSPQYWFFPNNHDLPRHIMKGYGHIRVELLPLVLLGLAMCVRRFRSSPHRAVLLAALAAPAGAALAGVGITRVLSFVIPVCILAGLGLEASLNWLGRRVPGGALALATFVLLSAASLAMLRRALIEGPLWFADYGLYGMQYGARQLFQDTIPVYLRRDPNVNVMVSSTWANGADALIRFFLTPAQQARVQMRSLDYYLFDQYDLTNTLLVLTPSEYQAARQSTKFKTVQVEEILPYPDGNPGFYIARLTYADDVAAIFAAEREARRQPVTEQVELDGQLVTVAHSQFGAGQIGHIFDGDRFTLVRGLEANPLVIEVSFPQPRRLSGLALDLGFMSHFSVTIEVHEEVGKTPVTFTETFSNLPADPHLDFPLQEAPPSVSRVRVGILNLQAGATAQIHVRELELR